MLKAEEECLERSQIDIWKPRKKLEQEMCLKTDPSPNSVREWRRVALELREAQTERLKGNLAEKSHQGSYYRQVTNRESYVWLSERRLRPQTEALILAAQDDVLHTSWYKIGF